MAMPDNVLSLQAVPAPMEHQKEFKVRRRSDFEMGGVALNDPSQGLLVKEWNCYVTDDLDQIRIVAPGVEDTLLYEGEDITEVSCTFDQNMRPVFAFVENGIAKLDWFDSQAGQRVLTIYGEDYKTPKVSLDDKRDLFEGSSDIIFAYVRDFRLYHRVQRDRYTIEYMLHPFVMPFGELQCIGMSRNKRFSFQFRFPQDIED